MDRQERTRAALQDSVALLNRDAGALPFHKRAELAAQAIEAARKFGLDAEVLRQHVLASVSHEMNRETLQDIFVRLGTGHLLASQAREKHHLLLQHAQFQRAADQAQQEHDELTQHTALERVQARRGRGQPLPEDVRQQLELGLNHDLSGVRVHTDDEADRIARSLHAVAFTSGKDIYFQADEYNTVDKLELLAHEVTHIWQQDKGQVAPGIDPDPALESEAQQFGENFVLGSSAVRPKLRLGKQARSNSSEPGPEASGAVVQRLSDPTGSVKFWFDTAWTHQFSGTLGTSHITMTLTRAGSRVTGTYHYQGHSGGLSLNGKFRSASGMATLSELDLKLPAGTPGTAELILSPNTDTLLRGGWRAAGKDLPISLTLADPAQQPAQKPPAQQLPTPQADPAPAPQGQVNPAVVQAIIDAINTDAKLHPNNRKKNNLGGINAAVLQDGITRTIATALELNETDFRAIAMIIANIAQESGFNADVSESLYYTPKASPETVFRRRFHGDPRQAAPYLRDSEKMANHVYANENGNGDEASGDGFRFRGAGLIQVTYRNNFHAWTQIFKEQGWTVDGKQPDFEQHPALVHHPEAAYKIAVYGIQNGIFTGADELDKALSRLPDEPTAVQFVNLRTRYVGTHDPMLAGRVSTVILNALRSLPLTTPEKPK